MMTVYESKKSDEDVWKKLKKSLLWIKYSIYDDEIIDTLILKEICVDRYCVWRKKCHKEEEL